MSLTQKKRLLQVLNKEHTDRPPVCCIGGMMNAAVVEIMQTTGLTLPEAHTDAKKMAGLAEAVWQYTGFENIAVPFCMTVEAELLGASVTLGSLECEPKIVKENYPSVSAVKFREIADMAMSGRINTVVEATQIASTAHPDVPVIVSLTGPVSTAASIVDPITFYKELRKDPVNAEKVLDYVIDLLAAYAERAVKAGASVIAVGDPSATGEILGPKMFEAYALKYNNKFAERVHNLGVPFILHICGDMKCVDKLLPRLQAEAISVDAVVSLAKIKAAFPSITTMGNVSTFALEWSDGEKVAAITRHLIDEGVNIISPACGLSTATKTATIRAMMDIVKAV